MREEISRSEGETEAIGRALGLRLPPRAVVFLHGPLGAGKTAFVRGLAAGIGADPADVSSPTFTIIQEYRGRHVLQHIDLYRLSPTEVDDLLLDDLLDDNLLAVEWPDRWRRPPGNVISVVIQPLGGDERRITITAGRDALAALD